MLCGRIGSNLCTAIFLGIRAVLRDWIGYWGNPLRRATNARALGSTCGSTARTSA